VQGSGQNAKRRSERKPPVENSCRVQLESGRWRHFGWGAFCIVAGALLVWKLGTVGKWVGVVLILISGFSVKNFVTTLLRPAGRIEVDAEQVVLPRGLCRGEDTVPIADVKHAFFLRRAIPWTRAGPVLVIEVIRSRFTEEKRGNPYRHPAETEDDQRIYAYPRDWFATGPRGDADQKRVAAVLNRRLERA
jgi:hypothetical protein